jgi:hypothetical protein
MLFATNSTYPASTLETPGCIEVPPSFEVIRLARLAEASFASTKFPFDCRRHDQDLLKTMPPAANAWLPNDMIDAEVFRTAVRPLAVEVDDGETGCAQNAFLEEGLQRFHEANHQQTLPDQTTYPDTSGPSYPQPAAPFAPPRHAHRFGLRLRRGIAASPPRGKADVNGTTDRPSNLQNRIVYWLLIGAGAFATVGVLSAASGFLPLAGFHLAGCHGCLIAACLTYKFSLTSKAQN